MGASKQGRLKVPFCDSLIVLYTRGTEVYSPFGNLQAVKWRINFSIGCFLPRGPNKGIAWARLRVIFRTSLGTSVWA